MENGMSNDILDKLLLQAIASNQEKVKQYDVQMAQIGTQIDILNKEIREYRAKYQDMCPHVDAITEKTHYMEGGYDHVSETQYETKCVRCAKVLGSELVRGTYA